MRQKIERSRDQLLRLRGDLALDQSEYEYAGRSYSRDQVRHDLERRFEKHKTRLTWGSFAPNQANLTECLLSDLAV
jgi:hypothetical protein